MLENVMRDKAFYFSYQADLSKSFQSLIQETSAANSRPPANSIIANQANLYPNAVSYRSNFVFNNYLLKPFDHFQYAPFKIPCIYGYGFVRTI